MDSPVSPKDEIWFLHCVITFKLASTAVVTGSRQRINASTVRSHSVWIVVHKGLYCSTGWEVASLAGASFVQSHIKYRGEGKFVCPCHGDIQSVWKCSFTSFLTCVLDDKWVVILTRRPLCSHGKFHTELIEYGAGWATDPVWTFWRRSYLLPCRYSNPWSSSP